MILTIGAAATYLNHPALGVAGAAVTAIPIATKAAREAQKFASGNFAAYLMHAQERLTPRTLLQRVGARSRKLLVEM